MKDTRFTLFKTYNTRIEAEVDKSALTASDIECMIMADDLGGTYPFPFTPGARGVELYVNINQLEKAKEVVI